MRTLLRSQYKSRLGRDCKFNERQDAIALFCGFDKDGFDGALDFGYQIGHRERIQKAKQGRPDPEFQQHHHRLHWSSRPPNPIECITSS